METRNIWQCDVLLSVSVVNLLNNIEDQKGRNFKLSLEFKKDLLF
jgi:hypothetical protein